MTGKRQSFFGNNPREEKFSLIRDRQVSVLSCIISSRLSFSTLGLFTVTFVTFAKVSALKYVSSDDVPCGFASLSQNVISQRDFKNFLIVEL